MLTWTDIFDLDTLDVTVPELNFDPGSFSLVDQFLLGVDGVDLFLGGLQDLFDGEIAGVSLPLIGDSLSGAADAIGDLRAGFVEDFRKAIEDLGIRAQHSHLGRRRRSESGGI